MPIWGRPRATRDAGFKVLLDVRTISELVSIIETRFRFRVRDPDPFARRTYPTPIYASDNTAVDLSLGFLPYEQ